MSVENRVRLLRAQDLFRGISEEGLHELAESCHVQHLSEKEELCHEGDDGSQIYLIVEGEIAAMTTGPDGDDVMFSVMRRGQLCGELAVFMGGKRTATMVARAETELLVINRRAVVPFLRHHPDAALEIISVLSRRVIRLSQQVADASFMNVPSRLAKNLLLTMHEVGYETEAGIVIEGYTQGDLGQLIMATRESVNKVMGRWNKAGIVSMKGRVITIHDLERLAEQVEN